MIKRLKTPILLTVLILFMGMVATLQSSAAPQPQTPTTLYIGWFEGQGSPGERGARLATEQINEAGGIQGPDGTIYQLELVYPQRPLVVAEDLQVVLRNLLSRQVIALIGPVQNRLVLPNIATLSQVEVPVLTLATTDSVTDVDANDNIIRVRAAERYYSRAMADILLRDLGYTRIAIVQTDIAETESLLLFKRALQAAGIQPVLEFQRLDNTSIEADAAEIISAAPEAVVMFGRADDATTLLQTLRSANYNGQYFYRDVLNAVNQGVMSRRLAENTIGVASWVYTTPNDVSRIFLVDYVTAFNQIPDDIEAAAYDAVWILRRYIESGGADATGLYDALTSSPPIFTVQGRLEPSLYANGDASRHVAVYQMRDTGGPRLIARYANDVRLSGEDETDEDPRIVALLGTITATPTATYTPSNTPIPTETPLPTATPSTVVVIGDLDAVNLRSGPSTDFDILGQFLAGEVAPVIAANIDYSWLVINWRGQQVWISSDVVEVFDPANLIIQLPIVDAVTIQTPGAVTNPNVQSGGADLIIDSVVLNPPTLIPGQPFSATVFVRNQGGVAAGGFTVGTTFLPGNISVTGNSVGVPANSAVGVELATVVTSSGSYTVDIVVDTLGTVAETNEANNIYSFSYTVSAPIIAQVEGLTVTNNVPIVMTGGTPDIIWDGATLLAQGNARLGVIPGLNYDTATLTNIDPNALTLNAIGADQFVTGAVVVIITSEGLRGVIRVEAIVNNVVIISYRVFNG